MATLQTSLNAAFFDEIALAYGANVRELRTAEKKFEEACTRALRTLLPHVVAAVGKAGVKVLSTPEDASPWKNSGWYVHFCLGGDYARKLGKKDYSGIGLGFAYGHFFDDADYLDFGFYPYVWFWSARSAEADTLRNRIGADLRSACPSADRVRGEGREIDLVFPPIAKLTNVDQARSSLEALVHDYPIADAWMADKVVMRK